MNKYLLKKSLFFIFLLSHSFVFANEYEPQMTEHANSVIKKWASNALVIDAINAQNAANAAISQEEIDKLDKAWRAETSATSQPMISKTLGNKLSNYLIGVSDKHDGLYTEIFVMDFKGLNVGQSSMTSDYWQGDEAKWKQTYLKGPDSIHIGDVEEDESTQTFQSQVSLPIVDPATNQVIGAITVGINLDHL